MSDPFWLSQAQMKRIRLLIGATHLTWIECTIAATPAGLL